MKKLIGIGSLLVITVAWLWFVNTGFYGLNTLLSITDYRKGIAAQRTLRVTPITTLPSPAGASQVVIDTLGIPHIFGKDNNAVAYAAGFMHARDRYFQMELLSHMVMGRLAEIIGEEGINSDKNWRRFNLEEKAKKALDSIQKNLPDMYNYLHAYEQGVNDYIRNENNNNRDPMYVLWNYSPQPWKTYYPFLIQWYMSYELTFYDDYENKQELLDKLPENIRQTLYPDSPHNVSYIIPSLPVHVPVTPAAIPEKKFRIGQNDLPAHPRQKNLGSNNWVVAPSRTDSGRLFLCNDLHLFLTAPNIFYELEMYSPGMHVYGYTVPGVPIVLTGHNSAIAWGITNGGWDVTEQYVLKINPQNEQQYWLNDKWETMTTKHFPIQVKDNPAEDFVVQYTVFGPVVKQQAFSYALKWHPAEGNAALPSFYKLMQAGSWNDFKTALRYYDYPSQNFVYGDTAGNIGMICAGKMPVKPAGYAGGLLDGTAASACVYIPFDSLPQVYNPSCGYLFSANQQPSISRYYYSAHWFEDLYRPQRINNLLAQTNSIGLNDMEHMQSDVTDLSVPDIQKLVSRFALPGHLSPNWQLLMQWNGRLQPGSKETYFYQLFRQSIYRSMRNTASMLEVGSHPSYDQFMNFLLNHDSVSYKGKILNAKYCFNQLMTETDSLYNLYTQNNRSYETAVSDAWSFSIPQITFLPGMDTRVNDMGGNDNTINVNDGAHPVIRTIISMDKKGVHSSMVNAIGQTGRLNDGNYFQQLQAWQTNALHATQFVLQPGSVQAVSARIVFVTKNNQ